MADMDILNEEPKNQKFSRKYRDFQLGFITENIVNIDHSLPLGDAIAMLKKDDTIRCFAVEEMDKVIGVLDRERAMEKGHSVFELLKGKPVGAYVDLHPVRYDASDFCEKAFYQILKRDDRDIQHLVIYEGTHFLGIIPINHLISHVSRIRELSYQHAHYIQQFLLDKSTKKTPGVLFKDHIRMAHQIGGDFYHIRKIAPKKYLFSCFDVASKDIAASLTTGLLSSFFTMYFAFEKKNFLLKNMIEELNRVLIDQTPEDIFVVAVFLYFDLEQMTVIIYNHGYSPLFVYSPRQGGKPRVFKINPTLMPLGINADIDLTSGCKKMALAPRQKFFVYSDGLIDGIDHVGIRFGEKRVQNYFLTNIGLKPDAFIKQLLEQYEEYIKNTVPVDDMTLIIMEVE
jgi:serine phosphatase RsbU (regulator of sigma subunit)